MDLARASATDLAADLKSGALSAETLMAATYDRIAAWNPHVNALVSLMDREAALALARRADAETAETGPRGPLHGLPFAVKDLAKAAGFRTSEGARLLAESPPAEADDLFVARIRAAGALIIGKTNTPEFGFGSHTTNPVHGATRNPWDLSRSAGGSSGGASVALATGMTALADGSDMMGSLRNPAGWSNTYGLRPSWGAVPGQTGGDAFLHQLSTAGPMARSPDDLALLLDVMAGPDPARPHATALPGPGLDRPLRIGWLGDWGGAYAMAPGILSVCEGALDVLCELGHVVDPCPPPFSRDAMWRSWITLRAFSAAASLLDTAPDEAAQAQLGDNARWELARGRRLGALEVHRASVIRTDWFRRAAALFETYDVLALPTAQCWPFDVTLDFPREIGGTEMDSYHRWMEVVVPASLIGLPALAVPAGFGPEWADPGLPMGVQLIGPRGADRALLALGQRFHEAAPWTGRRPDLPTA